MDNGRLDAALGRDGEPLFGEDFPIQSSQGYVVNMLQPTEFVMQGVPDASALSAPGSTAPPWIFRVVGRAHRWDAAPSHAEIIVTNVTRG